MHEIETAIDIGAPPSIVWDVLVDIAAYPEWNPFLTSIVGDLVEGQQLVNRLEPPGGRAMTFRPTVTAVDPGRHFEWLGHLWMPGVFDGRHRFEVHTANGGTHLIHREVFTGLLVPLLRRSLDNGTRAGFEAMNAALKARAEAMFDGQS